MPKISIQNTFKHYGPEDSVIARVQRVEQVFLRFVLLN